MSFSIEAGARTLAAHMQLPPAARWQTETLGGAEGARLVVGYALDWPLPGQQPTTHVVGKFYADDSGRHAYRSMLAVRGSLAERPRPLLAVPEPLFYDANERLLAQQRVAGAEYRRLAQQPGCERALWRAGQALAELHSLPIAFGPRLGLLEHLEDLMHPHPFELHVQLPGAGVIELIAALIARERAWPAPAKAAPLHRDFHLGQLFAGQGRVWLIDWDLCAQGDPALDVGNFLVYLRTHLAEHAERACAAFLAGYARHGSAAALARAPLYEAFTYLRLACKRYRLQKPGWRAHAGLMLRQSERRLLSVA